MRSPASGVDVNRPPGGVAEFRARTLQQPLAEPVVDGVLIRLWMLAPQVLAHEVRARGEVIVIPLPREIRDTRRPSMSRSRAAFRATSLTATRSGINSHPRKTTRADASPRFWPISPPLLLPISRYRGPLGTVASASRGPDAHTFTLGTPTQAAGGARHRSFPMNPDAGSNPAPPPNGPSSSKSVVHRQRRSMTHIRGMHSASSGTSRKNEPIWMTTSFGS